MERGLAYIGCSAGVACLGDQGARQRRPAVRRRFLGAGARRVPPRLVRTALGCGRRFVPGLSDFIVSSVPPGESLFAIDENTAAVGDGEEWSVMGVAGVHIYREGGWAHHPAGSAFAFDLPGRRLIYPLARRYSRRSARRAGRGPGCLAPGRRTRRGRRRSKGTRRCDRAPMPRTSVSGGSELHSSLRSSGCSTVAPSAPRTSNSSVRPPTRVAFLTEPDATACSPSVGEKPSRKRSECPKSNGGAGTSEAEVTCTTAVWAPPPTHR